MTTNRETPNEAHLVADKVAAAAAEVEHRPGAGSQWVVRRIVQRPQDGRL